MQAIVGAVHAAAGNKKGAKAAQKFRLLPKEKVVASAGFIQQRFPVDEALGGLITPEMIAAEQARLAGVTP